MADKERRDAKGRLLRTGEYYDAKTGRYRYSCLINGTRRTIYSWTLTKNDRVPIGKKQASTDFLRHKEDELKAEMLQGLDTTRGNMTLAMLANRYMDMIDPDLKPTTRASHRTVRKLLETDDFGKKSIKTITQDEVLKWFEQLNKHGHKGYSSLQTIKGVLKPAYEYAKQNRWVVVNPFAFSLMKKRYGGTKTRNALSREQMGKFLDFAKTDKVYSKYFDGFYILFMTGLRIGEFCGLTEDDIDFNEKLIHVRKQLQRLNTEDGMKTYISSLKTTAAERVVPFFGDVEQSLRNALNRRPKFADDKKPVLYSEDGKTAYSGFIWFDKDQHIETPLHWQNHLRYCLGKYNRIYKDQLPKFSCHYARHTFTYLMICEGVSPVTLKLLLGHSDISTTLNIYAVYDPETNAPERIKKMSGNPKFSFYEYSRTPEVVSPPTEVDDEPNVDAAFPDDVDTDED